MLIDAPQSRRFGRATVFSKGMAMVMSAMLSGVSAKAICLPQSLAWQWILLVLPPRDVPIDCVRAPF